MKDDLFCSFSGIHGPDGLGHTTVEPSSDTSYSLASFGKKTDSHFSGKWERDAVE